MRVFESRPPHFKFKKQKTKMRTGPTNEQLQETISELRDSGHKDNSALLLRIASDLSKATRQRRVVNLSKINRFTKDGETIVVPGKVLAAGELDHSVTIAAWKFSSQALEKIQKSKSKAVSIQQLVSSGVDGKKIRIMG